MYLHSNLRITVYNIIVIMGACTGTPAKKTNKSGVNNSNVVAQKSRINQLI